MTVCILEFLERWTTLHNSLELTYVVNGYELLILNDGNDFLGPFYGKTIQEAFDKASKEV